MIYCMSCVFDFRVLLGYRICFLQDIFSGFLHYPLSVFLNPHLKTYFHHNHFNVNFIICIVHVELVPVTTARRNLRLRMEQLALKHEF
jgi:hypothetical protein